MNMKMISWFCFLVGVAFIVLPIESMREQIDRYHLDFEKAELAAKCYYRGFWDKTEWSMVAVVFFLLALLLRSMVDKRRPKSEPSGPRDGVPAAHDP
jgi:H+/Cl- antiporter ClcA